MSITVPSPDKGAGAQFPSMFRPSGGGLLPGIPVQPSAGQAADSASSSRPRLVPARVGPVDRVQTIWIECPDWCDVDHTDRQGCLEDITHYSGCDVVQVSTMTDDIYSHSELYANISSDPTASDQRLRAAHILINDGGPNDAHLTPEMAEELADDLIAFAAQIRHKARQVRQFNQAEGQA